MVRITDDGIFDAPIEKIWKYIGDDRPGIHQHRAIPATKVLETKGNVVVQEMQLVNADGKGTHWETWRLTSARNSRINLILGKVGVFKLLTLIAIAVFIVAGLIFSLSGAVINGSSLAFTFDGGDAG
ncbi:MAG: hypothetical protein AABY08_01775, partial [Candidatus Thermoplasmatota archaeon]